MSIRKIYVDIDDVLSATIECLVELLSEMHGRHVDPETVVDFNLSESFELDRAQTDLFMERAHDDDVIESIALRPGASEVLSGWQEAGHQVTLVTGRPPKTYAASKRWLDKHELSHAALHHLDKWNREDWNAEDLPAIGFHEIPNFGFEFAVEDSLDTAVRLVEEFQIPVALMDRPWNRSMDRVSPKTRDSLIRCVGWVEVSEAFGLLTSGVGVGVGVGVEE